MKNKALILVDFENEWIDKDSEYYVGDISTQIKRTNELIDHFRRKGHKIIFTTHIEEESTEEFAPNSKNVDIINDLEFKPSDTLIKKFRISPFYKTNLEEELEGITHLTVCGILSNLCVRSLVQDAYDRDFEITVVKDCCISFDDKTQEFTFKDLKETREEIQFVNFSQLSKNK